jgi:hypothetical protein
MRSSSFKSLIPAAAVGAILAVAPIQLGSAHAFSFAQALAASPVGVAGGQALGKGNAAVKGTGGVATLSTPTTTAPARPFNKGAGNPYGASFGLYSTLR